METDVFNLGSGSTITINELADMMQKISGKKVSIKYTPRRPADVLHCKAKIDKIEKVLGFKPTVSIQDGLKEYLHWFDNYCITEK